MSLMKKISPFAQKVLDFIEPDPARQQVFLEEPVLKSPSSSEAMQAFKARINKAVKEGEKVLIAGDYDCDGVFSTAILKKALEKAGLQTGYYIPNRFKEGYGLSRATVEMAASKGYSLIVTVDNGVQAKDALQAARELGVDVIVTDHHQITEPVNCDLVVHPSLLEEEFSTLCGAGVAFECARALGVDDAQMLIFAAVASIADCMEVTGQTRSIISLGLQEFNRNPEKHIKPFVRSMPVNETDISFQVAPRVNSIGRLSDRANVNTFIRYLETDDPRQIEKYASQIETLNTERKSLSEKACKLASAIAPLHRSVVLAMDPSFHEGVIGLAAGSLCSKLGKPVIICTRGADGYKGSMRAPEGFQCLPFLSEFDGFEVLGGHDRAAGFTVKADRWKDFEQFVTNKSLHLHWTPVLPAAMPIDEDDISLANARALDELRPFGTGFEQPVFEIDNPPIVSVFDFSGNRHRRYTLENQAQMILFNLDAQDLENRNTPVAKAEGNLSVSSFRGNVKADFIISGIEYEE